MLQMSLRLWALVIVQEDKCAYCGKDFIHKAKSDSRPTFEHVVPKHKGGSNGISNGLAACSLCNTRKGGSTPTEAQLAILHRVRPLAKVEYKRLREQSGIIAQMVQSHADFRREQKRLRKEERDQKMATAQAAGWPYSTIDQ